MGACAHELYILAVMSPFASSSPMSLNPTRFGSSADRTRPVEGSRGREGTDGFASGCTYASTVEKKTASLVRLARDEQQIVLTS